tara:strand:- start:1135 stop:1428 length:294 start_codon:yes stop_codon:yes gene_type:complete
MTHNIEPNYNVILIAPAGSLEGEKHFNMIIPKIMRIEKLIELVVSRQGLNPLLDWQLFNELYPNYAIDYVLHPYLISYFNYIDNGRTTMEFIVKENV